MPIEILMPALTPTIPTPRSYLRMQVSIDAGAGDTNIPAIDPCIRRGERVCIDNVGGDNAH